MMGVSIPAPSPAAKLDPEKMLDIMADPEAARARRDEIKEAVAALNALYEEVKAKASELNTAIEAHKQRGSALNLLEASLAQAQEDAAKKKINDLADIDRARKAAAAEHEKHLRELDVRAKALDAQAAALVAREEAVKAREAATADLEQREEAHRRTVAAFAPYAASVKAREEAHTKAIGELEEIVARARG